MRLEQINQVLEVAKTYSINKAASNLFMSQSSLSLSIQSLEKELGKDIFFRTNQGVEITPFGRTFIEYIYPIQKQFEQLNTILSRKAKEPPISFSVANIGYQFVSEICTKLYNKYNVEGIRIELYDSYGDYSKNLVTKGAANIGIARLWSCYRKIELNQIASLGLQYTPVYKTKLSVMVGKGNPLYHQDISQVTVNMIKNYPMIKYNFMDYGPYADIIDRVGFLPNKSTFVTSSRAVIYEMLNWTDAYYLSALIPRTSIHGKAFPDIRAIPLVGTEITAEIGWLKLKHQPLSPVELEFTQLMEDFFVTREI